MNRFPVQAKAVKVKEIRNGSTEYMALDGHVHSKCPPRVTAYRYYLSVLHLRLVWAHHSTHGGISIVGS